MLAITNTCNLDGSDSQLVKIEAEILNGFSAFFIVGLAGQAIKESKERIRAALQACGQDMPLGRIIVNLYPADQHKSGSHWDLPIALSLLAAMDQIPGRELQDLGVIGELGLDGSCKPVPDAFALTLGLAQQGVHKILLPAGNLEACQQIEGVQLYPVHSLAEAIFHFQGQRRIQPLTGHFQPQASGEDRWEGGATLDYGEMAGQEELKRVMTVAAAGRHSLLLIGSPGLGKTMACDRFAGLLPDLEAEAAIQSASLLSMCGLAVQPQAMVHPPVRKPDCTITPAGFFGGGRPPKPGEISLAQNGVLIMDEFPLFSPEIINQLRFAMENRYIELSRGNRIWRYPADFQLIASMNPCPCGYHKDPFHSCSCTSKQIIRYLQRVPQPILDRFDMIYALKASYGYGQVEAGNGRARVGSPSEELKAGGQAGAAGQASGTFGWPAGLAGPAAPPPALGVAGEAADEGPQQEHVGSLLDLASYGKTTAEMRAEVLQARTIQADRYQGLACRWNGEYQVAADPSLLAVSPAGEAFYLKLARKYSLSRRAFFRLLKVARTLADLGGSPTIEPAHIMEALHYYQARYTYWPG